MTKDRNINSRTGKTNGTCVHNEEESIMNAFWRYISRKLGFDPDSSTQESLADRLNDISSSLQEIRDRVSKLESGFNQIKPSVDLLQSKVGIAVGNQRNEYILAIKELITIVEDITSCSTDNEDYMIADLLNLYLYSNDKEIKKQIESYSLGEETRAEIMNLIQRIDAFMQEKCFDINKYLDDNSLNTSLKDCLINPNNKTFDPAIHKIFMNSKIMAGQTFCYTVKIGYCFPNYPNGSKLAEVEN